MNNTTVLSSMYHDDVIAGWVFLNNGIEVLIERRPNEARSRKIRFENMHFFLAGHCIPGSVIDYIEVTKLTSCQSFEDFNKQLVQLKSDYYDENRMRKAFDTGVLENSFFVAITPSYGTWIFLLCEKITEEEHDLGS